MPADPYIAAAAALRDLAPVLVESREARFLPSRRVITERAEVRGTQDVANPTLDVVLDTTERLRVAVALWDNDNPEGTDHV